MSPQGIAKLQAMKIKRRAKKYGWDKQKPTVAPVVKAYVKRVANSRADKRHTYNQSPSYISGGDSMSTTPTFLQVVTMPSQSDTHYGREGDIITPTYFRFYGHVIAADNYNICRFILFQWMADNNVTNPSVADMFDQTQTTNSANLTAPYIPYRLEVKKLNHILYDSGPIKMTLASASYLNTDGIKQFDIRIRKKKLRKISASTSGAVSGVGQIYACLISDSGAITHPQIQWMSELHYIS